MSATATIPVTVTPEAAALLAELGKQAEFEQMVAKAKEVTPYLRAIHVALAYDPEGAMEPQVVIQAHRDDTDWQSDHSSWDFDHWQVRTFPPEVCLRFGMDVWFEAAHGR